MEKQELIDKVSNCSSFMTSFFDDYKDEYCNDNIQQLNSFFEALIQDLTQSIIPDNSYERISRLIDSMNIENLQSQWLTLHRVHNIDLYRKLADSIISRSILINRTYHLLKVIGFVNSNVVIIGANGSGKTTFANSIRNYLERTDNGIVLPAQKLLIFPTYSFVPTYKSAYETYEKRQKEILDDKQTFDAGKSDDIPYDMMRKHGSEMRILLSTLLGERIAQRDKYCSTVNNGDTVDTNEFRSVLDEVFDIWNNLIEERTLYCDSSYNLQIKHKNKDYPAYKMSDGEREILYVVGRVLLAKTASLIIIDEPESHLHKAIVNKLWDLLENKRKDCMFIYLTHDIDFAASRIAKKWWIKSYSADLLEDWDVMPIERNEIPEALLMKLLGSRKKILFCEGKKKSLDSQIYEILFPEFTITPLASCKDVINYTKAFNKIGSKYSEAFGIIDRDFRVNEQINLLRSENVFSFSVAEIENLFLMEDFIKGFAEYKKEKCDIDDIKNKVFNMFKNNIQQQVAFFVSQKIDHYFKEANMKRGKNEEEVKQKFSDLVNEIKIDDWFLKRTQEVEAVINNNDYEKAILLYNNKGLHSIIEQTFGITKYNYKALEFLKESDDAKSILRKVFPSDLY